MSEREDAYGNPLTEDGELVDGRLIYCCCPDCGCDGERLCMAENGASETAIRCNVEGMYRRTDFRARKAKWELFKVCAQRERHPQQERSGQEQGGTNVPSKIG